MRNFLRNFVAAAGIALSVLAIASLSYAQVAPSGQTQQRRPVPRYNQQQLTHYVRTTFRFTDCTQVTNACTVQLMNASLPYNAVVLRVIYVVYATFNSTTSDTVSIGTTAASANELVAATSVFTGVANLLFPTVVTASPNTLGNGATQSGFNGGFDLYLKWTSGTGNTATQGLLSVIIEYAAPNDGRCAPVPQSATATGC